MELSSQTQALIAPHTVGTTPELQAIITEIAARHDFDLGQTGQMLTVELEKFGVPEWLGIEGVGTNQVAISCFFEEDGKLLWCPRVVLFTGYTEWVPLSTEFSTSGLSLKARLNPESTAITWADSEAQRETADYCDYDLMDRFRFQNRLEKVWRRE